MNTVRKISAWSVLMMMIALLSGCFNVHGKRSNCLPLSLSCSSKLVDLNAPTAYRRYDPKEIEVFSKLLLGQHPHLKQVSTHEGPPKKNLLAISGGGMYGAFSVGVLKGWSDAGTRPSFDVVTGVSTGALISTFAFLGSEYDDRLVQFYTNIKSTDIYRERYRVALLWSESYASSEPLKNLIENTVTPELLSKVAAEHQKGRRLFVGTTNLDTRRFVIWDMGAIASRGDAEALKLYRKILLASASVPGFFPPVEMEIEINGQKFIELHADGGATTEVFIRPGEEEIDPEMIKNGHRPCDGYHLYVITSGKYYSDPQCVKRTLPGIASGTLSALLYAKTRDDLLRMYTYCLVTGMKFHVTALDQNLQTSTDSLNFDPSEMKKLYQEGYENGRSGKMWRNLPPETDPEEQVLPRTGTRFATPDRMIDSPPMKMPSK